LIWNENFVNARVGNQKLLTEMSTAGHFNDGKPLEYGLGLFVEEHRGVHNVYHSGSTAGYRAHLNRFPEPRTSVAVLCNGSTGDATRAANRVSDLFLGEGLKAEPAPRPAAAPQPALNPPPSAAQLNAVAGTYWSEDAETMLVAAVDATKLVLRRRPNTTIELTAIAPDTFRGSMGTVTFLRNASGVVDALTVSQDRVWDLRFVKR
jgi:hypothetical protein